MPETEFKPTLKMLRLSKNMTQKDLAKLLKISESTLSKWENEKDFPNVEQIWKIEDIFGVPFAGINFLPYNTV